MVFDATPLTLDGILSLLGISAIVSGIVSAFVNYVLTMRELKKKNELEILKDKLGVCSFLIFHLDEMLYRYNALESLEKNGQDGDKKKERYAFSNDDWKKYVSDIDEKIKNNYFHLTKKILEKWVWSKTLISYEQSIVTMPELRKMLYEEYNLTVEKLRKITDGFEKMETK